MRGSDRALPCSVRLLQASCCVAYESLRLRSLHERKCHWGVISTSSHALGSPATPTPRAAGVDAGVYGYAGADGRPFAAASGKHGIVVGEVSLAALPGIASRQSEDGRHHAASDSGSKVGSAIHHLGSALCCLIPLRHQCASESSCVFMLWVYPGCAMLHVCVACG